MSGNSRFPREMAEVRRLAGLAPRADLAPRYADSALNMALGDLLYSFSNVFFFGFTQISAERPAAAPDHLFPAIGWRLLAARFSARRAQRQVAALLAARTPYFLLPLQMEHDFQIVS